MTKKSSSKQVFFFTIINYVGMGIGVFSTLFIYPYDKEFLGMIRYIDGIAQLLFPIMILGASYGLLNYYPILNDYHKKQLFNYSIVSVLVISGGLFVLLFLTLNFFSWKDAGYLYLGFVVAFFLAFVELFKKQAVNLQKIVFPTLFEKLIPKITLPLIFILLITQFISIHQSLELYIFSYFTVLMFVSFYLFYYYKPKFNIKFQSLFNEITRSAYFKYSLYTFAGSFGSFFAFRIDAIMIPEFVSMEANGTYSIGVALASALAVPATGIFALYAPIISNHLKTNNLAALHVKYKEVSKSLFFIGGILFSAIFLGIEDLFKLLSTYESLKESIPIILILGCSVLLNMGTGFNSEIITYSRYYKFNIVCILVLIILTISLNILFFYYFKLGISGFAYASLLAMAVFNFAKLLFIYKKFGLLPFDASYIKLIGILISVGIIVYFLPKSNDVFSNLIYKVALCLSLNIFIVYKLKLVHQVNFWMAKLLGKF